MHTHTRNYMTILSVYPICLSIYLSIYLSLGSPVSAAAFGGGLWGLDELMPNKAGKRFFDVLFPKNTPLSRHPHLAKPEHPHLPEAP